LRGAVASGTSVRARISPFSAVNARRAKRKS